MGIRAIEITGLRGFAEPERLQLALPTGEYGSGITVLVGPNNAGKSTIIEAFRALTPTSRVSFTEGKRNKRAGDRVRIQAELETGEIHTLRTVDAGGSETVWEPNRPGGGMTLYVLPSRRMFNPYFGHATGAGRHQYTTGYGLPQTRGGPIDQFASRLFAVNKSDETRRAFNDMLAQVVDPVPDWVIDQSDQGQYYVKVAAGDTYHTSDGLGEGLVSLLFVIDALYDSQPGEVIVIDEPELSLHPPVQRRLAHLIADLARDRQIVYATHSPYFIEWDAILNGAMVVRVHKDRGRTALSSLRAETIESLRGLRQNRMNPHVLGLDACEVFFLHDRVVLVEGQEDVVCYALVAEELGADLPGSIFGWGVGGAGNMGVIAQMLRDLGFVRVVGILDGDAADESKRLTANFPEYRFFTIPAEDVRTKPPATGRDGTVGLLDEHWRLRPEHREAVQKLFADVFAALEGNGSGSTE